CSRAKRTTATRWPGCWRWRWRAGCRCSRWPRRGFRSRPPPVPNGSRPKETFRMTEQTVPNSHSAKRVAVVTGANRGIGKRIARQPARLGDIHVVDAARYESTGEAAAAELRAEGLDAEALPLDVASAGSVASFAKRLAAEHGRVDILVNNAGVFLDQGA